MFKLIRKTDMPAYNGTGYFYKNDKTGMEVFSIENDSEELTASFTFATPSQDSTGLAHILEHTVLSGSAKYPVKDPFTEIYNSSPNTFLNAMTFCDKTMYPFSSPLKKDFDIIFDIYADAVFAPLLRKQSFEQEGVRFYNGKVDGVVFNEMRGALSSEDSIVNTYSVNKLYKGTPYEYDSGGNPVHITELTYEKYLERYRQWYSPANCRLFLYGKLNTVEYLEKIEKQYLTDECLTRWTGKKIMTLSEKRHGRYRPLRDMQYCPAKGANSVVLTWLTSSGDDPFETLVLSVLTDILLGEPGAPLYKAITESGLGKDLNPVSGMDSEFPILPFTVGFVDAKKNCEDRIESFILNELGKIAKNGLDKDAVKAALKRQAFRLREIQGSSYPYGITVAMRSARYWLRGTEPEYALDNETLLKRLEDEVAKGAFFEKWILKNLVKNKRRCLLTVKEDKNYEKKLQARLDEKYREFTGKIEPDVYRRAQADFEEFIKTEDSAKELKKIPRIKRKDIPNRIPHFDMKEQNIDKVSVRTLELFTRGICYINLAFDVTSLNEKEKKLLPLLVRFMQMCGTSEHDYTKIGTLVKQYTGGFLISQLNASKTDGNPLSVITVRTRALEEDTSEAFRLVNEILTDSDFSDYKRIKASLTDLVTDFESSYLEGANVFATISSSASLSAICKEGEISVGTSAYIYLSSILKKFSSEKKHLRDSMKRLRDKVISKSLMTIQIGCEKNFTDRALENVRTFINGLPDRKHRINTGFYTDFKKTKAKTLIQVGGGPSYNSVSFALKCKTEKELAAAILFSSVVSGNFLFETIRGKNGAYGAECHVDIQEKIFSMSSYRDPEIEETYKIFKEALSYKVSKSDIDYTVVTILGKELKPLTPKNMCYEAFRRSLFGITDAMYLERRKAILSLTVNDMEETSKRLKKDFSSKSIASVSSVKNSALFENGQIVKLTL